MSRLKIALSELETVDADLFRASLARLVNRLSHHWEWADLARADLVIVDMDSLFGHMAWLKAHGAGKQVITFARSGTVHGSDLVLGKPLDDDAFAAVLEQAAQTIAAGSADDRDEDTLQPAPSEFQASVRPAFNAVSLQLEPQHIQPPPRSRSKPVAVMDLAAAGDVPPPPAATQLEPVAAFVPAPAPELEPEPVNVAEAILMHPPTTAMRVEGTELVIDPPRDVYYADATLKSLTEPLQRAPDALQPLDGAALETARQRKPQPLARLRWFAGLTAAPGMLARGLRDDERYKLTRWPQTEREFPRQFRIATAMMKEAATPADLAAACGVPLADVIDYINASRAAGWLAVERDEPPPVEEESQQRGAALLSRFRKPFGR
ncbi:MAG: hypothetical protein ABIY40_07890 [Rhodanobacteraceae bacterium]|nr:hypothetical protein [Pseudomonadota bacterium]